MKNLIYLMLLITTVSVSAQTKTTEKIQKNHPDATVLFFYHNTLRMLNQGEDKAFDELIKDVEKIKFLMFTADAKIKEEYKTLVASYRAESFEEIMTTRMDGSKFNVLIREGKNKGMILTVENEAELYILDIVGSVALDKIATVFKTINESSEVAKKIKDVTKKKE